MKERFKEGRVRSEWEEKRRKFLEEREISIEEVEKKKEKGEARYEELERRDKEKQRKERREKISESRFSRWYKEVKGKGIPDYLKKGWEKFITNTNKPTDTSKVAKKRKFTERETEEELKIQRIKFIIEQEQQLAKAKLRHEERMAAIIEINLKENNTLEIRANSAKAELAELQLKKEKDRIYNPLDSK
ncbi:coiled-coil domain-containing protein 34-like [Linepithema humile]|uniref:coiled-coil domain-containing protein 34-like n=1 Tax=Linepithema humile TaxID=83485 RepID=UPI00351E1662